ncbi:Putative transporter, AEC family protein [Oceanicola granulosus HTCC2516]|uniref:Putative transporter, AEC family protein n=1 Tax=Oceanicola granulosus (strain ATCC BAA-861 / DSM 15982 / KCTC 12143 / HTCC2516) TaxID=314256 RepID=Q2CBB7_OCEGH|nr:AEC family transporter [Oceanicola granulosus]EAR49981.1 Putative transporter, AEC family protein [Oceanicola granulosus HTCC2516]
MLAVFLETLPFFAVIGLGYGAGRSGFFTPEATAYLTKFVFYFALSAMLLRFSVNLELGAIFSWPFVWAYLLAGAAVYGLVTLVALLRGRGVEEAAVEAQCAVIGNVGFLGIPMLALLLGERAVGFVMLCLTVDLGIFGSLIVILIVGGRDGRMSLGILRTVGLGLLANPMIVSMALGLAVSGAGVPVPGVVNDFLILLGAAATPGALFAIGASLANKSAERVAVAGWLSFAKLVLHPAAVALCALVLFDVEPFAAAVMIAVAALPVAGNVYILAQHYGVAPQRVSASILISTAVSIVTVSATIAWVSGLAG